MRVGSVFLFGRARHRQRTHPHSAIHTSHIGGHRQREGGREEDEEGGEVGGGGGGWRGVTARERERERGRANKAREVSPLLTDPLC